MNDFLRNEILPFGSWVEQLVVWLVANFQPFLDAIKPTVNAVLSALERGLIALPPIVVVVLLAVAVRLLSTWALAATVAACAVLLGMFGIWNQAMITLSVALTGVLFCVGI